MSERYLPTRFTRPRAEFPSKNFFEGVYCLYVFILLFSQQFNKIFCKSLLKFEVKWFLINKLQFYFIIYLLQSNSMINVITMSWRHHDVVWSINIIWNVCCCVFTQSERKLWAVKIINTVNKLVTIVHVNSFV